MLSSSRVLSSSRNHLSRPSCRDRNQAGDPTNTGDGGSSVWGNITGDPNHRFFQDEIRPDLTHDEKGTVGFARAGPNLNASQFYITTGEVGAWRAGGWVV